MLQEFGYVGVTHRPNQYNIFRLIGVTTSQGSSHDKHGFHGSHTEIVMVLLTQLLGGEFVEVDHLTRQVASLLETLTEEDDLSD